MRWKDVRIAIFSVECSEKISPLRITISQKFTATFTRYRHRRKHCKQRCMNSCESGQIKFTAKNSKFYKTSPLIPSDTVTAENIAENDVRITVNVVKSVTKMEAKKRKS